MIKHKFIFMAFSENLINSFKKIGLKIEYQNNDVLDRLYVCPISLKCYTIDSLKNGNLSLEHIPPQSLGGKGILLTSKKENNQDGYTSDKELLSFFKSENFKNNGGEINVSINSEHFNLKGITAKLTIEGRETKPIVKLTSSTQNIKALDFKGLFQEWDGSSFSLNWKQHLNINKRALLKCAYLTAFSKIGYELIFDSMGLKENTYGKLIEYLCANETDIEFPVIYYNGHAPFKKSKIGEITWPIEFNCLVVNLTFKLDGNDFKYAVFLPHPKNLDLANLNNLHKLMKSSNSNVNFKIVEIITDINSY